MGLNDVVASAVGIAKSVTADLQAKVGYQKFLSEDRRHGDSQYGRPVRMDALVLKTQKVVRNFDGQEVVSSTYLAFLEPIVVGQFDIITLPDGSTGPILTVSGFVNKGTGKPYFAEVWMG